MYRLISIIHLSVSASW